MAESSAKKKRVKASLEEGTVWVWGDNARGQLLELPPCDEAVTPRLAERGLNGPLRGGWNALRRGEEGSEEAAQGAEHWLEVDGQGRLRGAGRSLEGQLGAVVRELVTVPRAIALEVRVTSVACGGQHSAAAGEGLLFTWGANAFGQLGHSAGHVVVPGPVAVGALWPVTVTAVALGARHSAALSATGRLFLFGCNTAGQCGPGRDDFVLAAVEQVSKRMLARWLISSHVSRCLWEWLCSRWCAGPSTLWRC
jgi:alpha-tubulin suppressor-like RCC1 family protein